MPFSDQQLADQMAAGIVTAEVMTGAQYQQLLQSPTEVNVRKALTSEDKPAANLVAPFKTYWTAIGNWLGEQGGNIGGIKGDNVPGRVADGAAQVRPPSIAQRALYDDAFAQVAKYIDAEEHFLVIKAISNHLRFIANIVPTDDSDED